MLVLATTAAAGAAIWAQLPEIRRYIRMKRM